MRSPKERITAFKQSPQKELIRYFMAIRQNKRTIINKVSHIKRFFILKKQNPYLTNLYQKYIFSFKNKFILNHKANAQNLKEEIDIIIPWYGDANIFNLIKNIFNNTADDYLGKIYLINDAFPEKKIVNKLKIFIKKYNNKKLIYLENKNNLGFIGSVNIGMRLTKNDFVLLNSDTLPQKNWLEEMLKVSKLDKKIATVTAMSNNATIFSWPKINQVNIDLNPKKTASDLKLFMPIDHFTVPTGHGFCLLIKKSVYNKIGEFDQKTFGKGYGEENDFCYRAIQAGYYHVAATKAYVVHLESQSFGNEQREKLIEENSKKLNQKWPSYEKDIAHFIHNNPLIKIKSDFIKNSHLFKKQIKESFVLIILHSNVFTGLGGVEICTQEMMTFLHKKKQNQLIYFYDQKRSNFQLLIIKKSTLIKKIIFDKESQPLTIFQWILENFDIKLVLIEHLLNHDINYFQMLQNLKIKTLTFIHDFYYCYQVPDLIVNEKFVGFNKSLSFWDKIYQKKNNLIKSQKEWQNINGQIFNNKDFLFIFNSEFTMKKYCEVLKLRGKNNFIVSYPDLEVKL